MHTPGPWHVEPEEFSDERGLAICSKEGPVAIIDHCDDIGQCDEDQANARLLAASPALLDVAEMLIAMKDRGEFEVGDCVMRARYAIALAKGDTK
jgi:hypothetical protein